MKNNVYPSKGDLPDSIAALLTLQKNLASALSQKSRVFQSVDLETGTLRKQNDSLRKQLYRVTILLKGLNLENMPDGFIPLHE